MGTVDWVGNCQQGPASSTGFSSEVAEGAEGAAGADGRIKQDSEGDRANSKG